MRIDITQAAASHISSEPTAEQVKARQNTETAPAPHEDRATFSAHSQSLRSLVEAAMSSPEVRQDKIDSLKAAVSSGKYELDSAKIAASMIDEEA